MNVHDEKLLQGFSAHRPDEKRRARRSFGCFSTYEERQTPPAALTEYGEEPDHAVAQKEPPHRYGLVRVPAERRNAFVEGHCKHDECLTMGTVWVSEHRM